VDWHTMVTDQTASSDLVVSEVRVFEKYAH